MLRVFLAVSLLALVIGAGTALAPVSPASAQEQSEPQQPPQSPMPQPRRCEHEEPLTS